jgi:hypothetical protein
MSNILIVLVVVLIIAAIAMAILKQKLGATAPDSGPGDTNDYTLQAAILSPAERSFLGVIEPLLPEDVGYLVKVRLGDVFTTRKGLDASRRIRARNRINQKHVDFLLIRTSDLKPLAGVELDDSSHDAEDRQKRDVFVDGLFKSCQLPLLHVPARATYNPNELRASLAAVLAQGQPPAKS